ncbi:hypothetical protein B484DRAFT_461844, partial [Ochromonadaceae sp. CCMP2298]
MAEWQKAYDWAQNKSIVDGLHDVSSIPDEWAYISNKNSAAGHYLTGIWLAYHNVCPLALSTKSRIPTPMSDITRPSGLMPMAYHQMAASAEERKYVKESTRALRKQQKADTKAAMEDAIVASDESSDSFPDPENKPDQGKSGGPKPSKKKRTKEVEKDESDKCKSDEDNEEYSNPDEFYALPQYKKPRRNMVRATRNNKKKRGKRMILDTGASHNTLQDLEYVEEYVTINKNRSITMKTASGHKIVPETDENLLSGVQLLKNRTGLVMIPGAHPYAIITTTRNKRIIVNLNAEDQFELPLSSLSELIPTQPTALNTII